MHLRQVERGEVERGGQRREEERGEVERGGRRTEEETGGGGRMSTKSQNSMFGVSGRTWTGTHPSYV